MTSARSCPDGELARHGVGDSDGGMEGAAVTARRVLIVDDDADTAGMLVDVLGSLGFEVAHAADGARALALAPTFLPDVVLLDLQLPDMSGYALARALRAQGRPCRYVVLSGNGPGAEADQVDAHLRKPAPLSALLTALAV